MKLMTGLLLSVAVLMSPQTTVAVAATGTQSNTSAAADVQVMSQTRDVKKSSSAQKPAAPKAVRPAAPVRSAP